MRIADRGGHAVGEHAAVEFERRDQRRFDVAVGVDEAGDDDLAADVDLADARVFAEGPDDPVVADRHVALDQFAADEIEDPSALQDDVGLGEPLPLLDGAAEKGDGVAHGRFPGECGVIIVSASLVRLKRGSTRPAGGRQRADTCAAGQTPSKHGARASQP